MCRIVEQVSARIGVELDTPASYHSKPIGEVYAYCTRVGDTEPTLLLRVAETPVAIEMRIASAEYLNALWDRCSDGERCMAIVPHSVGHGFLDNVAFSVEEVKSGVGWRSIGDFIATPGNALLAVAGWLTDFQKSTRTNECWSSEQLHALALDFAERARGIFAGLCPATQAHRPQGPTA